MKQVEEPTAHGIYEVLAQWDSDAGVWVAESGGGRITQWACFEAENSDP
jgi:hypothetical protein